MPATATSRRERLFRSDTAHNGRRQSPIIRPRREQEADRRASYVCVCAVVAQPVAPVYARGVGVAVAACGSSLGRNENQRPAGAPAQLRDSSENFGRCHLCRTFALVPPSHTHQSG